MKTARSIDVGVLPVYMRSAEDVPRPWTQGAKCKPANRGNMPHQAWLIAEGDRAFSGHPPEHWIDLARLICESCSDQYDCVRFALTVGEKYGTWGLAQRELQILRRASQARAEAIIDAAEDAGLSVHQVVVRERRP